MSAAEEKQKPPVDPDDVGRNEPVAPEPKPRSRTSGAEGRRRSRSTQATQLAELKRSLQDTTMMVAVGVLMTSPEGRATMAVPEVPKILERQVDQFAAAWIAVAAENERVARAIRGLLSGGVWLNAGIQTVALGGLVTTLAGRPLLPLPLVTTFVPALQPLVAKAQAEAAAAGAGADGAGPG